MCRKQQANERECISKSTVRARKQKTVTTDTNLVVPGCPHYGCALAAAASASACRRQHSVLCARQCARLHSTLQ